jgi:hypothetical protein
MDGNKAGKTEIYFHNESMSEHGAYEHPSHQNFDNEAIMYRKLELGEPVIAHSDDHHGRSIKSVGLGSLLAFETS